jgi:dihydrolipoamide dehydrogenase
MRSYDLAIIGSGPGGYVAALYASRLKLKVCVVEKDLVGGTCLNRGCIPTKSLLHSASVFSAIKKSKAFGINVDKCSFDFGSMVSRKDDVVKRLRTGIETLFKGSGVELIRADARLSSPDTVSISGGQAVKAKKIIVATGSSVSGLHGIIIDEKGVLSSDGILNLQKVPGSLVVIGGGVIGCEFASLFNRLGTRVTIVEMTDKLIPGQSREASKKLETSLKKNGVDIILSSKVEAVEYAGCMAVRISGSRRVEADKVLVCVGRRPNTAGIGLEELGIVTDNGSIPVDGSLRTAVPDIYAIGDCVKGPMLAHRASYDGMLACDNMTGNERKADYSNIPSCIWTDPEIASVGLTEEAARAAYPEAKVAKFPYLGSGKAYLEGETEGFVKIVGTPRGDLLGVEIFGRDACNLIGEATLAKASGMNIKDWSLVVHGHPTLSEILQEAAQAFCGRGIHGL